MGEVGGADERRAQSRAALEQPGLRVQLRRARVKRHAHLGAEPDQLVDRALLGGSHVGGGDHAQPSAAPDELGERVAKMADARPDHESADQVDRVGARELAAQLGADVRLALCVDQQVALGQRGCRQRR